jgi:hypothetical protein
VAESTTDLARAMEDARWEMDLTLRHIEDVTDAIDDMGAHFRTIDEITNSVRAQSNEWDINAIKVGHVGNEFLTLMDIQNRSVAQNERLANVIYDLNKLMPGFADKVDDLTTSHAYERAQIEMLIQSYIRLARARAEAAAIDRIMSRIYESQYEIETEFGLKTQAQIESRYKSAQRAASIAEAHREHEAELRARQIEVLRGIETVPRSITQAVIEEAVKAAAKYPGGRLDEVAAIQREIDLTAGLREQATARHQALIAPLKQIESQNLELINLSVRAANIAAEDAAMRAQLLAEGIDVEPFKPPPRAARAAAVREGKAEAEEVFDYIEALFSATAAVHERVQRFIISAYEDTYDAAEQARAAHELYAEAIEHLNSAQYINLDIFNQIMNLSPDYLNFLFDETGALLDVEDAIYNVTQAQINLMGVRQANAILDAAETWIEETGSLHGYAAAIDGATESVWDLVNARLALMEATEGGTESFGRIQRQIEMIRQMTESAAAGARITGVHRPEEIEKIKEVKEVGRIRDPLDITEESLQMLHDIATRERVINLQHLTPQVDITINEAGDLDENAIAERVVMGINTAVNNNLSGASA